MRGRVEGFTILEVLITVVILTVALLALSSLQTASVGTNYSSSRLTVATILAQDKLEELRNAAQRNWSDAQLADTQNNFTADTNGDGTPDYFDWNLTADHANVDGPGAVPNPIDENGNSVARDGYFRFWNIADNVPAANMKTISVQVQWQERTMRTVTLDTVVSEG